MNRTNFFKSSLLKIGSVVSIPLISDACKKAGDTTSGATGDCVVTPTETKGPFPIKTPSQLVAANIKSDRIGVALVINITILNKNNNCSSLPGALVDIWHCDKDGYYSEYGGTQMQQQDFTSVHFLRGRQTTDANGLVSFISIYPGWYRGRAPHIHLEVLNSNGASLLISQMAFPENISSQVYTSSLYAAHGQADTSNVRDNVFSDSLNAELATLTGNITDGFTLSKSIIVNG